MDDTESEYGQQSSQTASNGSDPGSVEEDWATQRSGQSDEEEEDNDSEEESTGNVWTYTITTGSVRQQSTSGRQHEGKNKCEIPLFSFFVHWTTLN